MKKEDAIERTEFLIDALCRRMKANINKAINSGAVDVDSYDNDFMLPKIITYAVTKDALHQTKPLDNLALKEAENLYLFI